MTLKTESCQCGSITYFHSFIEQGTVLLCICSDCGKRTIFTAVCECGDAVLDEVNSPEIINRIVR